MSIRWITQPIKVKGIFYYCNFLRAAHTRRKKLKEYLDIFGLQWIKRGRFDLEMKPNFGAPAEAPAAETRGVIGQSTDIFCRYVFLSLHLSLLFS